MEKQYILSMEELCFSLAYRGYDEMAAGMLKGNLGDISEESMELVFQTAARSLHTKGILMHLNEEDLENSFVDGFKEILDDLANSLYFLRCFNETEYGQFVLTIHKGKKGFVYHLVSNEIVHVLNYIERDLLVNEIIGFFKPAFNNRNEMQFTLSESQFQKLMEEIQSTNDHRQLLDETVNEKLILEYFIHDYHKNNGKIVNMSLIGTEENSLPAFSDVYLLLITDERVWMMHNSNKDNEQEPIITIKSINEQEWGEIVNSLIDSVKEF